jgi:hypothetical protein
MDTDLAVAPSLGVAEAERHALEALDAIERVDTPEQAEELLRKITAYQQAVRLARIGHVQERRWATIRLQTERKMGELLGPAEHGGDRKSSGSVPLEIEQDEKDARKHARKVAAVPAEVFSEYLEQAEEPTRAGLLRAKAQPASKSKTPPTKPDRPWPRKIERISAQIPYADFTDDELSDAYGAAEFLFLLLKGEEITRKPKREA